MRALVVGSDPALEHELAARGLELARDGMDAPALVTLAPAVEFAAIADLAPERWLAMFRAWVEEPFFAAQPWLRAAARRRSGSWVAVTSVLSIQPFLHGAAGACALALQTLVRVAAQEGVRANAVAPGWREPPAPLDPDLARADTPTGRLTTAAEVAAAVAWLLSDEAANVSGAVLPVDGGYSLARGSRPEPWR